MKKKLIIIACLMLAAVMLLTGCPTRVVLEQDYGYAVLNNGGRVVQYGEYVYFINGTIEGFDDSDRSNNIDGKVVKGGIYRAKLINGVTQSYSAANAATLSADGTLRKFPTAADAADAELKLYRRPLDLSQNLDFAKIDAVSFAEEEEDREDITIVDQSTIELVVSKYINSGDTINGGIYIFGEWLYYATPCNLANKQGAIQFTLTEFYRMNIGTGATQKIYTSAEAVSDYSVVNYGDSQYLLVVEGAALRSVRCTSRSVQRSVKLEEDTTGVILPRQKIYYKGLNENSSSDFIYYTRALIKNTDKSAVGNVMERRRPDLSETTGTKIFDDGNEYTIVGADNGFVFYYVTGPQTFGAKTLMANDFAALAADTVNTSEIIIATADSALTEMRVFHTSNGRFAVALNGTSLVMYSPQRSPQTIFRFTSTPKILAIDNDDVYYADSSADIATVYKINLYADASENTSVQVVGANVFLGNTFKLEVVAGQLFFLNNEVQQSEFEVELNKETSVGKYMYFKQASGADKNSAEFFLGVLGEDDLPQEEEEE